MSSYTSLSKKPLHNPKYYKSPPKQNKPNQNKRKVEIFLSFFLKERSLPSLGDERANDGVVLADVVGVVAPAVFGGLDREGAEE